MKPLPHEWKILLPFNRSEAIRCSAAARRAGVCERTVRYWCEQHGLGRKVGGVYSVSKVALAMYLDGNMAALNAYRAGDRESDLVVQYFRRESVHL